jgi:hypothetical protein
MDILIAFLRKCHTKHNLNYNLGITDFNGDTCNDKFVATLRNFVLHGTFNNKVSPL